MHSNYCAHKFNPVVCSQSSKVRGTPLRQKCIERSTMNFCSEVWAKPHLQKLLSNIRVKPRALVHMLKILYFICDLFIYKVPKSCNTTKLINSVTLPSPIKKIILVLHKSHAWCQTWVLVTPSSNTNSILWHLGISFHICKSCKQSWLKKHQSMN